MSVQFTRQELYEKVWAQPMVHVGAEHGVSGNAIKKYFTKYGIPVPGRGYWAKLKAGKRVTKLPLPLRGPGLDEPIILGKGYSWWGPSKEEILNSPIPAAPGFHESIGELETRAKKMVGRDAVKASLRKPHRLLIRYLKADDERRRKYETERHPFLWDAPLFSTPFERRRLISRDALMKTELDHRRSGNLHAA